MNIHELDSYNLGDAVKFHRRLNPSIWGRDEHLLPEVREKLLAITEDFQEFLGVEDLDVQDITISGSNAAYSYTKNSDIDLHLVVTMPDNPVYQELFTAKKYQYNDEHNIKIGGADVELYVQPADQAHHSQGIYSVKNSDWISIPQRKRARVDDACVRDKVADLDARIHAAVKSRNINAMSTLWDKIKTMRRVGLEQHGEFGCENISFKMLRNSGCIKLLKDAMTAAQDRELSLREAPKQKFRYGFSEGMQSQPYSTPDGVAGSTKQFLEDAGSDEDLVRDFIQHVVTELGIDPIPEIVLHTDPKWSEHNHSFGRYDPDTHTMNVSMPNRHILDVLRTVAHELVHCSQNQQHGELPADAGETGSRWENDANARAGIIMRDWANTHPEHFELPPLEEGASGYIPKNKREAAKPQYAMALSVDIQPGQVGKEANKLALHTGRNGEPGLLMKTANLREYAMPQPSHGPGKYRDLNEPLGPETPPEMPDGTIKVDVSDMYDWYKLGQKISDLDSIKSGELGSGPPSTVFAFGSEDLENQYSHALTRLGLKTHDLDEPGEEDVDESVGDRPGDPTSNREFVSNKYLVKFTPTEMLIYKSGDLVYRRSGDYADLKRSDVYMAKSLTSTLWNKDQKGLVPNLEFAGAEKDLLDQYRKFEELKRASPLYSPERTKYERKSLQITRKLKDLRKTQSEWKPKAVVPPVSMTESARDYQTPNTKKLDSVLARCCQMIERGQQKDPERYGRVAACVVDPDHRHVYGINLPGPHGTRRHAERVAINKYRQQHGDIPSGSIIVTTLSPCNSPMDERAGESCKDLLNSVGIHQVYCGYVDPTQHNDEDADFDVTVTQNDDLWESCKAFADTFLHEDDLEEGWRSALAGAAAAGAMAFAPAPTSATSVPAVSPGSQPAAVQQLPMTQAEAALTNAARAAGMKGAELAQFLAQCAHESADFKQMQELGGAKYLAQYDPTVNPTKAKSLGNTQAGDGARYKGRGFIQITGKANYANAGQALGIDLVNNPELAAKPDVAAKIAVWYWQNKVAPYVQDFSDTRGVTKRINPGLQGLQDRQSNFKDYQQQVASAQPRVAPTGAAV